MEEDKREIEKEKKQCAEQKLLHTYIFMCKCKYTHLQLGNRLLDGGKAIVTRLLHTKTGKLQSLGDDFQHRRLVVHNDGPQPI